VILGRLVDLGTMRAERTLAEVPPDEELTTADGTSAVLLLRDGRMQGWKLPGEGAAWTRGSGAPCQGLVAGGPHLYAVCGNAFVSFRVGDGAAEELDGGPEVMDGIAVGSLVAVRKSAGRVALFETATNKLVARKALPELSRALHAELVTSPTVSGPCLVAHERGKKVPNRWGYRIGCYDNRLQPVWNRTISFPLDPEATYDMVRQAGPYHVLLDDQPPQDRWKSKGRGVTVRLRDGAVDEFADGTFATLEKRDGERVMAPVILDLLRRPLNPTTENHGFLHRHARVASDGERAFLLIVNERTELAGVELGSGRILFRVPVTLGTSVWTLETARGLPIVRSRSTREWRATIHDPVTGRVLYEDRRPLP
jgi:hypothetical protein